MSCSFLKSKEFDKYGKSIIVESSSVLASSLEKSHDTFMDILEERLNAIFNDDSQLVSRLKSIH